MSDTRMPALFIGHGSPMNVIEDNVYTRAWQSLGELLPRPRAIVVVSAHWYTQSTQITGMDKPSTIHDFYGFPQALYDTEYPAPGCTELAEQVAKLLASTPNTIDRTNWGLDHASWGILIKMYPKADIPVLEISLDGTQSPLWHLQLAHKLACLRDQGVLLMGSGNAVHNLSALRRNDDAPYDWALTFNDFVKANLNWQGADEDHPLVHYLERDDALLAHPTPEHYLPLLYAIGTWNKQEPITIPIDGFIMGSLSMLSVQVG